MVFVCRFFAAIALAGIILNIVAAQTADLLPPGAKLEKVASDCKFTEGPAADADGNVYFTDSPSNRIMVLRAGGKVEVWNNQSKDANGMRFDAKGRLVVCCGEDGARAVRRYEKDGQVTALADRYEGKRLTAPNDLCFDQKGRIYFTDPCYGRKPADGQDKFAVYRIEADKEEPVANKLTRVIDDVAMPNGIAISPDDKTLYVADNAPGQKGPHTLIAYDIMPDGSCKRRAVLHDFGARRGIDGMVLDRDGNIYATAESGDKTGVYVFSPAGKQLGFIRTPETATNCTFGDKDLKTLYITAGRSLYKIRTNATGFLAYPQVKALDPKPAFGQAPVRHTIVVENRKTLAADKIDCERIALGEPDDYKPDLVLLPSGELILVAFHQHKKEGGKVLEQNLLFRSKDGGRTWSKPEKLDQLGREPYLTVLKDGTLFMTGHLLANDVRNKHGYTHGYLHRSTDAGKSWESIRIESEGIKPKASNHSTRNVLQLADGTLLLGVDYDGGDGPYLMWRSKDGGKSWGKTQKCEPKDFESKYGFFGGETWLMQARSGKVWALVRVDSDELPIKDRPIKSKNDQSDHFILFSSANEGKTFDRIRDFGDYGEMYMSILRLQDKRLLLTFTVRDLKPPLGVRAIPGTESEDGFGFDFMNDRIMLDTRTPTANSQGGGFGPTVQLKDGTLVTCYSFRGKDDKTHLEVVRWKIPAEQ